MKYSKLLIIGLANFFILTANAQQISSLPNFTKLIKENAASVVQITAISDRAKQVVSKRRTPEEEELLKYFFGNQGRLFNQPNRKQLPQNRPKKSHGSGFFIKDGFVLTNAHVVSGANMITVITTDQKEYDADLIGIDKKTDVALLKINAKNPPSVKVGNSDKIEVGNWVVAIGSPFGFDYTATKGIISAVSRSLPDGTYVPFIQTDAAVNPGNSGGPLFNLKGEVIGINSQIYSSTGTFNGLAFAIPINVAMNVVKQLKEKGYVSRGWLGVGIQNVSQSLASSFGLDHPTGALISSVVAGSPAQKAGLKAGDIILEVNSKVVKKSNSLPPMIGSIAIGGKANLTILRANKKQNIEVTIGELDEGNRKIAPKVTKSKFSKGFNVTDLTKSEKNSLHLTNGIIIKSIEANSIAQKSGFLTGDIILSISSVAIKSVSQFEKIINQSGENQAILINRAGNALFIPLKN